jgi:predicted transcriptional regulator
MKRKPYTLTKVEFQVMSALWDINQSACAWDILERMDEPKPAYTTVATHLKVLREKGFVDCFRHKGEGKAHRYMVKVTRAEYTRQAMQEVKRSLFGDSIKKMLCFFVREENLTAEDVQTLLGEIEAVD